jgi:hypothetical protein
LLFFSFIPGIKKKQIMNACDHLLPFPKIPCCNENKITWASYSSLMEQYRKVILQSTDLYRLDDKFKKGADKLFNLERHHNYLLTRLTNDMFILKALNSTLMTDRQRLQERYDFLCNMVSPSAPRHNPAMEE